MVDPRHGTPREAKEGRRESHKNIIAYKMHKERFQGGWRGALGKEHAGGGLGAGVPPEQPAAGDDLLDSNQGCASAQAGCAGGRESVHP